MVSITNQKLIEISQLQRGWDGYYAEPIPSEALVAAQKLINIIPPDKLGWIVPTKEGVQVEWQNGKYVLELETINDDYIECFQMDLESDWSDFEIVSITDTETILGLVEWIYGI